MQIRISFSQETQQALLERLRHACRYGQLRLVRRIQALLCIGARQSVADAATLVQRSEQSVRNYVHAFLHQGLDSLVYRRPPGRPPRLTKSQKKELCAVIDAGPEAAGYDQGGWTTDLIQDWIARQFQVTYTPQYIAQLLKTLGYSYQKARFVTEHFVDVAAERETWWEITWPAIVQHALTHNAVILFEDECSFAQWGTLSYTWARKGQQPVVKTSGKRHAYKVFGCFEFFTGNLLAMAQTTRFNGERYQMFLREVLSFYPHTHVILIQDGARYHTSRAMRQFFADHQDHLTVYQLPRYSPDFNPIEFFWRTLKKHTTHLRYFPSFADLVAKVDAKLHAFTQTPEDLKSLLKRYCQTLGELLPA
jgi:transposase